MGSRSALLSNYLAWDEQQVVMMLLILSDETRECYLLKETDGVRVHKMV
jgi:hypothetical protein